LKKQGRAPQLIACDLQRPAAIEQLATLGQQIDVPVFTPDPNEKDVQRAAAAAIASQDRHSTNIEILDTAGRQEIDAALIEDLKELKEFLHRQETLHVDDAPTGPEQVSVQA